MRFGFVIPLWIYDDQRKNWAEASIRSLGKTCIEGEPPVLVFVVKNNPTDAESESLSRSAKLDGFEKIVIEQPVDAVSIDAAFVYGVKWILQNRPAVTHIAFMTCDWLYHPNWLIELRSLIQRHPEGKAWWVYRSAHEKYHKTLRVEQDVLVRSINAGGCFPSQDYRGLNLDYHQFRIDKPRVTEATFDEATGSLLIQTADGRKVNFQKGMNTMMPFNNGLTLDLIDPWMRPGERWVTKRSWILNIGVQGVNQQVDAPEYAIDFVGFPLEDVAVKKSADYHVLNDTLRSGTTGLNGTVSSPIKVNSPSTKPTPMNLTLEMPDGWKLTIKLEKT